MKIDVYAKPKRKKKRHVIIWRNPNMPFLLEHQHDNTLIEACVVYKNKWLAAISD